MDMPPWAESGADEPVAAPDGDLELEVVRRRPLNHTVREQKRMELVIRKARREDAMAAWDIRNAAILAQCAGHYPEKQLATWTAGEITDHFIQSIAGNWYVATMSGAVVGTGMLDRVTGEIDAIFVRPDTMGRGVGSAIMAYLEILALETGLRQLTLNSTLNAAPFYKKCGFVGDERSEYKSPRGISLACIPMAK